jgi:hypothetical protein
LLMIDNNIRVYDLMMIDYNIGVTWW